VTGAKSRKGFMGKLFKGDRYNVVLFTRKSRKVNLKYKSSDNPTWDETHYFLTNPDSVLTAGPATRFLRQLNLGLGACHHWFPSQLNLSRFFPETTGSYPT